MPILTDENGNTLVTEEGAILLTEAETPAGLVTPLSDFTDLVRAILGDHDDTWPLYEAASIARVVKSIVRLGESAALDGITLGQDGISLTPALSTPAQWAELTYRACRRFLLPNAAASAWGSRALRESVGDQYALLCRLEMDLYDLENPGMAGELATLTTWCGLCGWLSTGLSVPVYHVRRTYSGALLLIP